MKEHKGKLQKLFVRYPEIKLVYLFGSQVEGKTGPLSDYDFAIYLDERTPSRRKTIISLELNGQLLSVLKTNTVDVVVLNHAIDPLLKYNAMRYGILIYEIQPYRIIVEPMIYNEYFDFQLFAKHNNI